MRRVGSLLAKLPRFSTGSGAVLRCIPTAVCQQSHLVNLSLFSTFTKVQQLDDMDDFGGGDRPRRGMGGRRPTREVTMEISEVQEGNTYSGTVVGITGFGAFVDIGCGVDGLVHISQISNEYVREVRDYVDIGQDVQVKVLGKDMDRNKLSFTMKMEGGEGRTPMDGGLDRRQRDNDGGMGVRQEDYDEDFGGRSTGSRKGDFDEEDEFGNSSPSSSNSRRGDTFD
eukprot:TRINITY_DN2100_c0_g2_i1.p2 TRINITY_DN2100_c0_g2~~TRINITY_DN2100_c0_g2_i1.p2  ORF type:complete len:226 (-),score=43.05 TRINITY_DN2100_c0_g2_i1:216-893(-)